MSLLFDIGRDAGILLEGVAVGAGMALVNKIHAWWTCDPKHTPVQLDLKKDFEIEKMNREIRLVMGASRVYIGLFSNGSHYLNNAEIKKYSWAYEDTAPGIARVADRYQNMLTSLIPDEIKLIDEPGPSFRMVDELSEGRLQGMCRDLGVAAIARCAIRNGNEIFGFVGLDYVARESYMDKKIEKPTRIEELPLYAARMQSLLGC